MAGLPTTPVFVALDKLNNLFNEAACTTPFPEVQVKLGGTILLDVGFSKAGAAVNLDAGAQGFLWLTPQGGSSPYLISLTWQPNAPTYTFQFEMLNDALITDLGTEAFKLYDGEINWQLTGSLSTFKTPSFVLRLLKPLSPANNNRTFVTPGPTGLTMTPRVAFNTGVLGSLDAIPTAGGSVATGDITTAVVAGTRSDWQLQAGTGATDVPGGIVRPVDYDASTNARTWIQLD
jgi:hypothetical protein